MSEPKSLLRKRIVFSALPLVMLTTGCAGQYSQEAVSTENTPSITATPFTEASEPPLAPVPAPTVAAPLAQKVLNIVVVDTIKDRGMSSLDETEKEEARVGVEQLLQNDPDAMYGLTRAFSAATFGRLDISEVRVRKARKELNLPEGCLDTGYPNDGVDRLNSLAETLFVKNNAINIIMAMAASCGDDPETGDRSAGFYRSGYSPTILAIAATRSEWLYWAPLHEWAHDETGKNYIPHAGKATCEDPARAKGCVTDQIGDEQSLMSYANPEAPFSVPELDDLGLLRDSEVIDVKNLPNGRVELSPPIGDVTSPKMIKFTSKFNGRKISANIAAGNNGTVEVYYDKSYKDEYTLGGQPADDATVRIDRTSKPGDVIVKSGKMTITYLGRASTGTGYVLDVANA